MSMLNILCDIVTYSSLSVFNTNFTYLLQIHVAHYTVDYRFENAQLETI